MRGAIWGEGPFGGMGAVWELGTLWGDGVPGGPWGGTVWGEGPFREMGTLGAIGEGPFGGRDRLGVGTVWGDGSSPGSKLRASLGAAGHFRKVSDKFLKGFRKVSERFPKSLRTVGLLSCY